MEQKIDYAKLKELVLSILAYTDFRGWQADKITISWIPRERKIIISEVTSLSEPVEPSHLIESMYGPAQKDIDKRGFIYCLKADNGLFKIGKAKDVENRFKQIEPKLPYELELICKLESDDYAEMEANLHRHFADQRVRGEWFELTEADIEYIKGLGAQDGR